MTENAPEVTALHAAAEQVRQQLGLPAYNEAAVRELARFIAVQRAELAPGSPDRAGIATALGCFLGQCLVHTYHAEWAAGADGTTGVGLANQLFFNPFYLVHQQLNNGEAASVATFFRSVPQRLVAAGAARTR